MQKKVKRLIRRHPGDTAWMNETESESAVVNPEEEPEAAEEPDADEGDWIFEVEEEDTAETEADSEELNAEPEEDTEETEDLLGKAPVISDIRIKEAGKTLQAGDVIHISASVKADRKVVSVCVHMRTDKGDGEAWETEGIELTYKNGRYEGSYKLSTKDAIGTYYVARAFTSDSDLEQINTYYDQEDSDTVKVAIKNGADDGKGPSITDIKLTEAGKTLRSGDTIHVSAKVSDSSGISSVFASLSMLNDTSNKSRLMDLKLNKTSGRYEGSFRFSGNDVSGEYFISYVTARDGYMNLRKKTLKRSLYSVTFSGKSETAVDQTRPIVKM